jgi:hypothetical protein
MSKVKEYNCECGCHKGEGNPLMICQHCDYINKWYSQDDIKELKKELTSIFDLISVEVYWDGAVQTNKIKEGDYNKMINSVFDKFMKG